MLPDAPPYMKWDEEVARQLTDFNKRLQHLERLEDPGGGYNITRAYKNAAQAVPGGARRTVDFEIEERDDEGMFDPLVSLTDFTIQNDGYYLIVFAAEMSGLARMDFTINTVVMQEYNPSRSDTPDAGSMAIAGHFTATEVLEFQVLNGAVGANNIIAGEFVTYVEFIGPM